MKRASNTTRLLLTLVLPILFFSPLLASAEVNYIPLEPTFLGLPAGSTAGIPFGEYLTRIFTTIIGLSIMLAVLMIVWGGFQYLSTDAITDKEDGKAKWTNALYGLVLVLASYLLLQTINNQIVLAPNTLSNLGALTSRRVQPIAVDNEGEIDRLANRQTNTEIDRLNSQAEDSEALGDTAQAEYLRAQAEQLRKDRLTAIYQAQGQSSQSALNALIKNDAETLEASGNTQAAQNLRAVGGTLLQVQAKTDNVKRIVDARVPTQASIDTAYSAKASLATNIAKNRLVIENKYGVNSPEATRFRESALLNLNAAQKAIDDAAARRADYLRTIQIQNTEGTPAGA